MQKTNTNVVITNIVKVAPTAAGVGQPSDNHLTAVFVRMFNAVIPGYLENQTPFKGHWNLDSLIP
jgi:hypothetical protein